MWRATRGPLRGSESDPTSLMKAWSQKPPVNNTPLVVCCIAAYLITFAAITHFWVFFFCSPTRTPLGISMSVWVLSPVFFVFVVILLCALFCLASLLLTLLANSRRVWIRVTLVILLIVVFVLIIALIYPFVGFFITDTGIVQDFFPPLGAEN